MNKKDTAKKMKRSSMSGGERGNVIEGDQDDGNLTSFNKKDIAKEKATRRAKNSKLNKGGDFET